MPLYSFVTEQGHILGVMFLLGVCLGVVYDLMDVLRKVRDIAREREMLGDFCYWIVAAFVIWRVLNQETEGILRFCQFFIGASGMILYYACLLYTSTVCIDELAEKITEILATMQTEMLERARAHREAHTYDAHNYEEFKEIVANKPGFIRGMWCGDQACEDKIKEDTTATSRCMPFTQEAISDVCVCCGKPAKKLVYWGKAY